MMVRTSTLWLIAASVALSACSDRKLTRIVDATIVVYDNKLAIEGRVCTSDPSAIEFPLKVLFIIDTSQSMGKSDPIDPAQPDPTLATGRSTAIQKVIREFIDLDLQLTDPSDPSRVPTYCNTSDPGCKRGSTSCVACNGVAPPGGQAMCVGPDCSGGGCGLNGACVPLCDVNKAGCRPGEKGCPDCIDANDRCINGMCAKQIDPGVEFAIMRFGSAKQIVTLDKNGEEGFTNDPAELVTAIPQINNNGSVTDYEGALAEAYTLLSRDMRNARDTGSTAINRAKYLVIFLSDGAPYPRVTNGNWSGIAPDIQRDLIGSDGSSAFQKYNVPDNILRRVKDLMSLKALYGIGEIRLHTAYLASPEDPFWKADEATTLLKQMAELGNGVFRNFASGSEINFLHVDFSSLRRVFRLKNFIVSNINARPVAGGIVADSDGDGIDDRTEKKTGSHIVRFDSDNDGFSDTLEHFYRTSGWDALDPTDADCSILANDRDGDGKLDDSDGDGLLDCEERFLGTNRNRFDSDADGIPDGLEVRFNTNPVANDVLTDLDFDSMPNGDEVRLHTDPRGDDAAHRARVSYRYDVVKDGNGREMVGLRCEKDDDCPQKKDCVDGFCRCADAMACSTLTACTQPADCTEPNETCDKNVCVSPRLCQAFADAKGNQQVCVQEMAITCYKFSVENIQLVTPQQGPANPELGWNNIMLYSVEAPFDNQDDPGNFKVACVRARYKELNGAKIPATGRLKVPTTAWKDPLKFDMQRDCYCPDGTFGTCASATP
jgi:hypothetical protein